VSLKDQILKNMKQAMKERNLKQVKVLRFLSSAIKNKEIELRPQPLKDEHVIAVLKKQIKQSQEALENYQKADYKEQSQEEEYQISILKSYLPKALSTKETLQLVQKTISEKKAQSIKDMGLVMKTVMAEAKSTVDGKVLSQIVKEELSKL